MAAGASFTGRSVGGRLDLGSIEVASRLFGPDPNPKPAALSFVNSGASLRGVILPSLLAGASSPCSQSFSRRLLGRCLQREVERGKWRMTCSKLLRSIAGRRCGITSNLGTFSMSSSLEHPCWRPLWRLCCNGQLLTVRNGLQHCG